MKENKAALIYAAMAVLLWSTVATAFKIALREMNSYYLLLSAAIWSALALFTVLLIQGKLPLLLRIDRKQLKGAFFLGLLNPVAYYLILFRSYELLPAQIAQPLNYTWPIMLVILSIPLLKQPPRRIDALSLGLCFIGIMLISSGGQSLGFSNFSSMGIILALSSSILWAFYWIMNRKLEGDPQIRMFLSFSIAVPVLLLIGIAFPGDAPPLTVSALLSSAYVGFFEMGITFVFWSLAMKHAIRSADIGNLVYLSPFLSLIWITLFLGESYLSQHCRGTDYHRSGNSGGES